MNDKEYLTDFLSTEKFMSSSYNTCAGECADTALRGKMLDILDAGHKMQNDLFTDMSSRGWYPMKSAEPAEVEQVKTKFNVK